MAQGKLLPLVQQRLGGLLGSIPEVEATTPPMRPAPAFAQPEQPQAMTFEPMKSGQESTPWYKNQNLMDSLALGFNSMRLNPDQGLAGMIQSRMKTSSELAANNRTAQAVAGALRAKGFTQEAALVEQSPSMAGEFAKLLTKGTSNTETIQTREQTAKMLGHAPGSKEYNTIIAGGKPTDIAQGDWDKAKSVRGEFQAIPAVKAFSEQSQAFGRIVASAENPSPAGDLALIFNFMKVLDPGSTVREGEFANAQNAGSIDDRVRSLYNQIIAGTRLSEDQRGDFVNRAGRLYGNAEQGYLKTENFYRGVAERAGLNPDEVMPSYRYSGAQPQKTLKRPEEVPQNLWDGMSRQEKQDFINAG